MAQEVSDAGPPPDALRRRLLRTLAAAPLLSAALPATARSRRIVVIGGGLAGLVAALELTRAGHEVKLLEAQDRVGGRARTLRGVFDDGLHAELGPLYVPDTHELTLHYCRQFGLRLAVPAPGLAAVRLLRGRRLRLAAREPDWPYALREDERGAGIDELRARYERCWLARIGNPVDAQWNARDYAALDDADLIDCLAREGASPEAIALLGASALWGDGLRSVSALCLLRDGLLQDGAGHNWRIVDGVDALPQAFASQLGTRVVENAVVTRIETRAGGVRVIARLDSRTVAFDADRVICALPFWQLRRIDTPVWSAGKREAIAGLRAFSALRTSFQMRRRFWLDRGDSGAAQTDHAAMPSVFDVAAQQPGERGLLQVYTGGIEARRLAALPERDRHAELLALLEQVHPGAAAHCERVHSWSWDEAPWAGGASAWFGRGEMQRYAAHLATPESRVHFAGDHTSPWIRWMQGALYSGLRAAREVHQADD